MAKGTLIVIEGSDGSGKGTQHALLCERLKSEGADIEIVDFPRYEEPSSYFVTQYLNGAYGTKEEVEPKECSIFYALDRYAAKKQIHSALERGAIVVANRFTSSSMAHQGAKLRSEEERRALFEWIYELEHTILKIPKPDFVVTLIVNADVAQANVDGKVARNYTKEKRDIHEKDVEYLRNATRTYQQLCDTYPEYVAIDCMKTSTTMRSIEEIGEEIWKILKQRILIKS